MNLGLTSEHIER